MVHFRENERQFASFVTDGTAYDCYCTKSDVYSARNLPHLFPRETEAEVASPPSSFLALLLTTYVRASSNRGSTPAIITARAMCVTLARTYTRAHPSREVSSRNANTVSSCSCCESRYDRLPQLRRARRVVFCFIVNSSSEELQQLAYCFKKLDSVIVVTHKIVVTRPKSTLTLIKIKKKHIVKYGHDKYGKATRKDRMNAGL